MDSKQVDNVVSLLKTGIAAIIRGFIFQEVKTREKAIDGKFP